MGRRRPHGASAITRPRQPPSERPGGSTPTPAPQQRSRSPLRQPATGTPRPASTRAEPGDHRARSWRRTAACGAMPVQRRAARRDRLALDQPVRAVQSMFADLPRVARAEGARARRLRGSRRRGCCRHSPRACVTSPTHAPPAARRSPPGSRAPRRSGSTRGARPVLEVEAADAADPVGGLGRAPRPPRACAARTARRCARARRRRARPCSRSSGRACPSRRRPSARPRRGSRR